MTPFFVETVSKLFMIDEELVASVINKPNEPFDYGDSLYDSFIDEQFLVFRTQN